MPALALGGNGMRQCDCFSWWDMLHVCSKTKQFARLLFARLLFPSPPWLHQELQRHHAHHLDLLEVKNEVGAGDHGGMEVMAAWRLDAEGGHGSHHGRLKA